MAHQILIENLNMKPHLITWSITISLIFVLLRHKALSNILSKPNLITLTLYYIL